MLEGSCDWLGSTRSSLRERGRPAVSSNDGRRRLCEKPSFYRRSLEAEEDLSAAAAAAFSDVSFFGDADDAETGRGADGYQCTLAIIKPEAARLMYKIESIMDRNGFIIKTKAVLRLTEDQVAEFYCQHALEMFFPRLVEHMSSGPVAVYALAKRNAVEEWRRLIGPADVSSARRDYPISLRAVYGTERGSAPVANAFHGSDSGTAAEREIRFFFPNGVLEGEIEPMEEDVEHYIQNIMMPTIKEGLSQMNKLYPNDPLRWFGNWLLTKNVENS